MKKAYLLYLFIFIFLAGAGFLGYKYYQHKQINPVWHLIPQNTLLVTEVNKPFELIENSLKLPVLKGFIQSTFFDELFQNLKKLSNEEPGFEAYLKNTTIFTSFHVSTSRDYDQVFYLPLQTQNDKDLQDKIFKNFQKNQLFRSNIRIFQDKKIWEVIDKSNPRNIFSFTIQEDFLIGSFTPFLIEDVIRTVQSGSFLKEPAWKNNIFSTEKSQLKLYLRGEGFANFIHLFANKNDSDLKNAFQATQMQFESLDNQLVLIGNTETSTKENENDFLSIFQNQAPQAISCTHLIPENTGVLYYLGFSDGKNFFANLENYWKLNNPEQIHTRQTFSKKYNIDLSKIQQSITNEIAIGRVESVGNENNRFLLIKSRTEDETLNLINNAAKNIDLQQNTNPFVESYAGLPIRQINFREFPAILLGELASGFSQSFYTEIDTYFILAGNIQTLKNLIDNYNSGNNWKNEKKDFLHKIQEKTNFSLLVNTPRAWSFLTNDFAGEWQQKLYLTADKWKNFENIAFQIIDNGNHSFQTSGVAFYKKSTTAENVLGKFYPVYKPTKLDTVLIGQPFLFKNNSENTWQSLVQDKAFQLYCLDKNGKMQWKKFMNFPVSGPVYQIDYNKNGRSNYALIAQNELFLFNNKGESVENFPVVVPANNDLHTLSIFDYDRNKDYRFMISDMSGDLFLYSKLGKPLDGWKPKKSGYRLAAPAQHIRVANKDYIFALQQNGTAQVWNRKGQLIPGFPLKSGLRINSVPFIKIGSNLEETSFTAISEDGQLLQFNLAAQKPFIHQFLRISKESYFNLCVEENEKDWFVIRQDPNKVSILDKDGNELITKELENIDKNSIVQYYDFGADVKVFFITQPALGKTFLYDYTGKQIGEAIENQSTVSVLYVSTLNKLLVYKIKGREAGLVSVKIK